jgi:hypothetical protein
MRTISGILTKRVSVILILVNWNLFLNLSGTGLEFGYWKLVITT